MPLDVLLVVLLGALLHALWNALVRAASDKLHGTLRVVWGSGLLTLVSLPFLPLPAPASWPYLAASVLIHVAYFSLLAFSYRAAELSLAYPVMRGTAPAITALAAALLLQEMPSAGGWAGIVLICGGVLLLALGHGAPARAALRPALGNALVIAAYTLVDGQGARLSGHAFSYTGWIFLATAVLMLGLTFALRGPTEMRQMLPGWRIGLLGLLGGGCTLASYALALWAMIRAPIATVAALRETSIVFAALIGLLFLKERLRPQRLASVLLVCAGASSIKLF